MATNTYVALDKKTIVGSSTTSITFSSISSAYTDLRVVINGAIGTPSPNTFVRVGNGTVDTGSNYSATYVQGTGSVTNSGRFTGANSMQVDYYGSMSATNSTLTLDFMNYSNTTTNKSVISRFGNTTDATYDGTGLLVGLWRSTVAINTITIFVVTSNFSAGTTFSLYGIRAEGVSPAPKATGGAIYSDDDYYYHAFGATGTFTPLQSLTCDYVIVAGGGGSGYGTGGGGGAGGFRSFTSQSLTAGNYTATVGGGGSGSSSANSAGGDGTNSSFNSISTTGGGGGGSQPGNGSGSNGRAGGSGGGAGRSGSSYSGGAGNLGGYTPVEGFGGGNNQTAASNGCGGGGGAGGAGVSGTTTADGAGGVGATSALVTAIVSATGIGQLVSGVGYIAGGGGGGGAASGTKSGAAGGLGGGANGGAELSVGNNGTANTGGGAGGAGYLNGGSGGSGVVIVRYLKA